MSVARFRCLRSAVRECRAREQTTKNDYNSTVGRTDVWTDGHSNSTRLAATQLHVILDENCGFFFVENFRHSNCSAAGQAGDKGQRVEAAAMRGLKLRLRLGLGLGLGLWLNLVVTCFKVSQLMRKFRCKNCFFFVFVFCCCFLHAYNKKFVYNKYRNCLAYFFVVVVVGSLLMLF